MSLFPLNNSHHLEMNTETDTHLESRECSFCSYQYPREDQQGFLPDGKGRSLDELIKSSETCIQCHRANERLRMLECELHDIGEGATQRLDVHLVAPNKIPDSIPELSPDTARGKEELWDATSHIPARMALQSMQSCLRICLANHGNCRKDTDSGWLPTRLIDVRDMKLKLSADIPGDSDRRYIALSHQWGTKPFLTLNRGNLETFMQDRIPLSQLRRTFRDAVEVAKWFRVRYLWIDSLCIVQGSKLESEWHREASTMAHVYRNALVTFAASKADHISSGFSSEHLFGSASRSVLEQTFITGPYFRVSKTQDLHPESQMIVTADRDVPLNSRAWVMQEHLLAPRTIHFGDSVVWECREMTAKQLFEHPCVFPSTSTLKAWTAGLEGKDCSTVWNETVMKYSGCKLSVRSDKLVAIAGLARVFSPVLKSEYITGLWTRHLADGLLWETLEEETRGGSYIAPTWSWASVEGRVQFQKLPEGAVSLVQVEQATSVPVALDSFGEVKNAFVDVKGRLVPLGHPGLVSRALLHNDQSLRVSLDRALPTDVGRYYLLPLAKHEAEKRYWSLLVFLQPPNEEGKTVTYRRLGLVRMDLIDGEKATVPKTWARALYPRASDGEEARPFRRSDFEGSEVQIIRLD
ncbi:HET domain-containing protein [Fusarium sp. LHS14.1]|nr:HET domain-containing protein [Fusarium sp. LHS14.1]